MNFLYVTKELCGVRAAIVRNNKILTNKNIMIRDTEYYHHNLTTTTTNDKAVTVVFAIAFDFLFSNNNNNKWFIEYKNDVKVRSDYFGSYFSHSNCFDMNFGREFVEKCAHLSIPFT